MTDLRQEDFRIFENGKPHEIRLFAPIDLAPAAAAATAPALVRAGARPSDAAPSTRRIFLIVLGRGDLQNPGKGLDGMIHLVKKLMPQDLVAVMAWNRATAFSADHEQIAGLIERYRTGYRRVEALLAQYFGGLAAIYGSSAMPEWVNDDIDAILRGPDAAATRAIVPTATSTRSIDARRRREIDLLQGTPTLDVIAKEEASQIEMSFDEYVSTSVASTQDLTRIYAGLEYLRHFDGDKHLIFVTPTGLHLPSTDDDRDLARIAQDARVAITIFHTQGMDAGMWAVSSSRNIAEFTGGQFTGLTYGDRFADRIEATTRTGYQLGYQPADSTLDGRYRRVSIEVNRRGARVLYQHGYYAREEFTRLDRRQMVAQSRVEAALRYWQPVADLQLSAAAKASMAANGQRQMVVQVNVAPEGLSVTGTGAERVVSLDVAVFCLDRQYLVGYLWRRVDVRLGDDARYDAFMKYGVGFTVSVALRRSANLVKTVVYDYAGDRIGTLTPPIK